MDKLTFNGTPLEMVEYPNGEIALKTSYNEVKELVSKIKILQRMSRGPVPSKSMLRWENCTYQGLLPLKVFLMMFNRVVRKSRNYDLDIWVEYFPYQRSDRDFFGQGCIVLEMVLNEIMKARGGCFGDIIVNDPHCELLRDRYRVIADESIIIGRVKDLARRFHAISEDAEVAIVYPDKTSAVRYRALIEKEFSLYSDEYPKISAVTIDKCRDVKTGEILSGRIKECTTEHFPDAFIIVDDICDRGGTFLLAQDLVKAYFEVKSGLPKDIPWFLAVSHNTPCDKNPDLLDRMTIVG